MEGIRSGNAGSYEKMKKKEKLAVVVLLVAFIVALVLFFTIRYKGKIFSFNKVLVYFVNYDEEQHKSYVTAVMREVAPFTGAEEKMKKSIDELLKGPIDSEIEKGIVSSMPEKASLLNVRIVDEVAYLDFSKSIEDGGGILAMTERLAQIVYTATQFPSVKSVILEVEGKEIEYFSSEGIMDVASPMTRDNFKELVK